MSRDQLRAHLPVCSREMQINAAPLPKAAQAQEDCVKPQLVLHTSPAQQHCIKARGVPWLMHGRGDVRPVTSGAGRALHAATAAAHRPVQAAVLFAPPGYQQYKAHSISSAVGQDMRAQRTKPTLCTGTHKGGLGIQHNHHLVTPQSAGCTTLTGRKGTLWQGRTQPQHGAEGMWPAVSAAAKTAGNAQPTTRGHAACCWHAFGRSRVPQGPRSHRRAVRGRSRRGTPWDNTPVGWPAA
jgi:hypothetical protein